MANEDRFVQSIKTSHTDSHTTFKSPEMLAPARMPVAAGKKTAKTVKKCSSLKSDLKLSTNVVAMEDDREDSNAYANSYTHGQLFHAVLDLVT